MCTATREMEEPFRCFQHSTEHLHRLPNLFNPVGNTGNTAVGMDEKEGHLFSRSRIDRLLLIESDSDVVEMRIDWYEFDTSADVNDTLHRDTQMATINGVLSRHPNTFHRCTYKPVRRVVAKYRRVDFSMS